MAFPETDTLDDFTGTGPMSPDGDWAADPQGHGLPLGARVDGVVTFDGAADEYGQYWANEQFGANQEARLVGQAGAGGNAGGGVLLRLQNPGTPTASGYAVEYRQDAGTIAIYQMGNGVYTQLGAAFDQVMGDGDGIGGWCDGTTIRAYHFDGFVWTPLGERTDATYNLPGYIGFRIHDDTVTRTYSAFGGGTVFSPSITGSGVAVLGNLTAFGTGLLPTITDRYAYLVPVVSYGHGLRADPADIPIGTPHVFIMAPDQADGIAITYANLGPALTEAQLTAEIAGYGRGVTLALCQTLTIPGTASGNVGSGVAVLGNLTASGYGGETGGGSDPDWTFDPDDYATLAAFIASPEYLWMRPGGDGGGRITLETGAIPGGTGKFFRCQYPTAQELEVGLDIQMGPATRQREIWSATEIRFQDTWRLGPAGQPLDDKTAFIMQDKPGIGGELDRWTIHFRYPSYVGDANNGNPFMYPMQGNPHAPTEIWNGQWGVLWRHFRIPWNGDNSGIYEIYWNDILMHYASGFSTNNTPNGSVFRVMALGRNTELLVAAYRDWGRVKVWLSRPAEWPS